jgi:hypothetical protein
MISEQAQINTATEVVIYLKNGTRKYGMLIEKGIQDAYHFISNTDYYLFEKTNNENYIEVVPANLISTIDTDLK